MSDCRIEETVWRLVSCEAAPGAWQMAADQYLLRAIGQHPEPVIARLYRFLPPAISLGYHQKAGQVVDLQACAAQGIDVVRRPTGGRALLHRNEINYAVVADTTRTTLFGSRLSEAFARISAAVAAGLSRLGLEVEVSAGRRERSSRSTANGDGLCAASTTRYEIACHGRKIAAAAQLRSADKLLQHGMIYLSESTPIPNGLFLKRQASGVGVEASGIMTALRDLNVLAFDQQGVVKALEEGFTEVFGMNQTRKEFQPEERAHIAALVSDASTYL